MTAQTLPDSVFPFELLFMYRGRALDIPLAVGKLLHAVPSLQEVQFRWTTFLLHVRNGIAVLHPLRIPQRAERQLLRGLWSRSDRPS
jgi:hypothetical protein